MNIVIARKRESSMKWHWCPSCWQWERDAYDGPHYSMAFLAEQTPTSKNFSGTPEELERFRAGWELLKEDRQQAINDLEHRIDGRLAQWHAIKASFHRLLRAISKIGSNKNLAVKLGLAHDGKD